MKSVSTSTETSDGGLTNDGIEGKLYQTIIRLSTAEARLWLFRQLVTNKLATRDIYHFSMKQANIRLENKNPDPCTVKYAMLAKTKDVEKTISRLKSKRKELETELYTHLGERRYKYRKVLDKMKADTRENREKKIQAYRVKIEHYNKNQIK